MRAAIIDTPATNDSHIAFSPDDRRVA